MAASIKEALQTAIAHLDEAECLQVMEFIQDSLRSSITQEEAIDNEYVSDDELFESVEGVLVVRAVLAEGVKPEEIEFAVQRDREVRERKLMSW